MATTMEPGGITPERRWFIVSRWQEYQAEASANLWRIIAIGAFYAIELLNFHGIQLGGLQIPPLAGIERQFHLAVTAICLAWAMMGLGILLLLKWRIFPRWLKFFSTGADVVFLTTILLLASGPKSPLVVAYFVILVVSALRFSLRLIWCASLGSIGGYLYLLGHATWFTSRDLTVPRYQQLIVILALVLTGALLGQIVRRVRRLAESYAPSQAPGKQS